MPLCFAVKNLLDKRLGVSLRMGENHCAAVALHVAHYNFVRTHKTLRVTPAMAAGVETTQWDLDQLLAASEAGVA